MALRPLPTLLAAAGIALTIVQSAPLHAQSSGGWVPLHLGQGVSGDVRVMVVAAPEGYEVYFKNAGTSVVHFGFYVTGPQTEDDVSANGRIHLKPRNAVGPLTIKAPRGAKGTPHVRAVEAVAGERDVPTSSDSEA